MPTPKVNETITSRHAQYRAREANEKNLLKTLGLQAQGKIPPDEPAVVPEEAKWFNVTITADRNEPDKSGRVVYVMSETELLRLQHDLSAFKLKRSNVQQGTYVFADSGQPRTGMPGTTMLAYYGLTITHISPEPDFQPPGTYSVSLRSVSLLMRQGGRPRSLRLFLFENKDIELVDTWAPSREEAKELLRSHHRPDIQQLADNYTLLYESGIPDAPCIGSISMRAKHPKLHM